MVALRGWLASAALTHPMCALPALAANLLPAAPAGGPERPTCMLGQLNTIWVFLLAGASVQAPPATLSTWPARLKGLIWASSLLVVTTPAMACTLGSLTDTLPADSTPGLEVTVPCGGAAGAARWAVGGVQGGRGDGFVPTAGAATCEAEFMPRRVCVL